MRRVPALLLLLALVGGLGASSVHDAEHAAEWAEAQTSHTADHHDADGDHAGTPCADGDVHALDCAVCSGWSGAIAIAERAAFGVPADDAKVSAVEAHAAYRRAVAPARGPPAMA